MRLATLANNAFLLGNWAGARAFRRDLARPQEVQAQKLAGYASSHGRTEYGRRYNLSRAFTPAVFQRQVPLTEYEDYAPGIEQIAAGGKGGRGVLTRGRVERFAVTSGSSGAEKWIPSTAWLRREFRSGIAPWLTNLHTHIPDLRNGPAYWSITPVSMRSRRTCAIPIGFDEDSAYLGGVLKRLADATFAVPGELRHLHDMDTFRYWTLLALLRERDLRLISIWHPSFLTLLLEAAREIWEELLADIHQGVQTLPAEIPAHLHKPLRRRFKANPERAAELRSIGPAGWEAFWPRLALISCWRDAHARGAADQLAAQFPRVRLQGKGLLSTEAFVSLPIIERGVTHYPLAIHSHFFEFLEEGGNAALAHQVETGGEYEVVVTTGGGLYRYRTHDRVRITGRLHNSPCMEFLGRTNLVSDLCGEKMNALFVAEILREIEQATRAKFLMLAPDGPGYTLFIEGDDLHRASALLEDGLRRNPHYDYCRRLGQLVEARVFRISRGGAESYLQECTRAGQRLGDIKPVALHRDGNWAAKFRGAYVVSQGSTQDAPSASPAPAP
jgi:hypothetical protein